MIVASTIYRKFGVQRKQSEVHPFQEGALLLRVRKADLPVDRLVWEADLSFHTLLDQLSGLVSREQSGVYDEMRFDPVRIIITENGLPTGKYEAVDV